MNNHTCTVLAEIANERTRQNNRWGQQDHDDHLPVTWEQQQTLMMEYGILAQKFKEIHANAAEKLTAMGRPPGRTSAWDVILLEEVYETVCEDSPERIREELVQVAAVAVAWIEALDRRINELPPQ